MNSIRARMTLAFAGIAIIPLLLAGVLLGWQSVAIQRQQALALERQTAQHIAATVGAFLQGLDNELSIVAEVEGLKDLPLAEQQDTLLSLLYHHDAYQDMILLDSQGQERLHLSRSQVITPDELGNRSHSPEFLLPSSSGQSYYSPVRFDEVTGEPLMTIAVPLIDPRIGQAAGVLVAEVHIKAVRDLIASFPVSGGESVYIVDTQGQVIAHRNPSVVLRGTHFALPAQEGIQNGLDGSPAVLAADSLQLGDQVFEVVAEKPLFQALNLAVLTAAIIAGLTVLVAAGAGVLGALTVRRLVQPIETLAVTAQAIEGGEMGTPVEVTSRDELGILAGAFNSMTGRLRELISGLEQEIAERKRAEEALRQQAAENARLYDEARHRSRELALLNRVIAASVSDQGIESILQTVCRELALTFDLPRVAAALLGADQAKAEVVAGYAAEGQPPIVNRTMPTARDEAMHYLLQLHGPTLVDVADMDPELAPLYERMRQRGLAWVLLLPLLAGDRVAGIIRLESQASRQLSANEVDLAWRVAEQMSWALARIRLAETQRHLSAAIEQAVEGVLVANPQGVVFYVNPSFERISGYAGAQVIGLDARAGLSPGRNADQYRHMWQTIAAGQVWQGRLNEKRPDGSEYAVDAMVTPVRNQAGEIISYVATGRDVTREEQLAEQFRQAQKMEALGRLAGGIAHDFNNLLTVINLNAQLMQRRLHRQDPLLAHVREVAETCERASNLTRQLLSFSRGEIVEPRVLSLNDVIGTMSPMLQRIIGEDIELKTALAGDLWPVKVGPSQIEQVIVNLSINARDAMPAGGVLTIEAGNIVLDEAYTALHVEARPGEHAVLSISDTGSGMSDEVKARIFEPFFTTKERGRGTGLGLATVFGIVKQSGGHITVYSEVGQGTTFKIYLPRARREDVAGPAPAPAPAGPAGLATGHETILIVEDDASVRTLAQRVLASCGYQVLVASDGRQALEISRLHDGPIHLLLTDVVMPQMGGKELADRLQPLRPEMHVLYFSGYTEQTAADRGLAPSGEGRLPAAGQAFLSKPFTVEILAHKVRAVLDKA